MSFGKLTGSGLGDNLEQLLMSTENSIILGIHDGHDSGACLLCGGKIVCAVSSERLTREKGQMGFPREAIESIFSMTGVNPKDINQVAVAGLWGVVGEIGKNQWEHPIRKAYSYIYNILPQSIFKIAEIPNALKRRKRIIAMLHQMGLRSPIRFIDHHEAHAYSAMAQFWWHDAVYITIDGSGDGLCQTIWIIDSGQPRRVAAQKCFFSAGWVFEILTEALDLTPLEDEGKIMAMATEGKLRRVIENKLEKLIACKRDDVLIGNHAGIIGVRLKRIFQELLKGFPPQDIAATLQRKLEIALSRSIANVVMKFGHRKVVLSGGVAANVKSNGKLLYLPEVEKIAVSPVMGDVGLCLGAAFKVWKELNSKWDTKCIDTIFLGPKPEVNHIKRLVQSHRLTYKKLKNRERAIARLLAHGFEVCVVRGRLEIGPRALGGRSILCSAKDPTTITRLNQKLGRPNYMPFAPMILDRHSGQCMNNDGKSVLGYMNIALPATEFFLRRAPAACAKDGTIRPQVMTKCHVNDSWKILYEFEKLTGEIAIINTSFNLHGEPIVCTTVDAIKTFIKGSFDTMCIEDYLVIRPNFPEVDLD